MSGTTDSGAVESAPVETASTENADSGASTSRNEFKSIVLDSQDAADSFVKDRVSRAQRSVEKQYKTQVDDLNAKIEAFENEKLSESDKIVKRAEAAEKLAKERGDELTKMRREMSLNSLAADAKLPRDLWDRVRGDTEEEISADIAKLKAALPATEAPADTRPPSQQSKVTVAPTGQEPDADQDAKSIVDSLPGFLNF